VDEVKPDYADLQKPDKLSYEQPVYDWNLDIKNTFDQIYN